jgi:hypothetical protein
MYLMLRRLDVLQKTAEELHEITKNEVSGLRCPDYQLGMQLCMNLKKIFYKKLIDLYPTGVSNTNGC